MYAIYFQISAENLSYQVSIIVARHKNVKVENTDQVILSTFLPVKVILCLFLLLLLW